MNSLIRSFLITSLLQISGSLVAQDAFQVLDRVYGMDPLLYNGKKYSYFLPRGTGGNQFLFSAEFLKGDMVIRGKEVYGVDLNYDIYNQKLLLQYLDENGASQIIEISGAWLDRFSLGNREFRYFSFDGEARIYQIMGEGPFYVLFSWRKNLKLTNSVGNSIYAFSGPVKSMFVLVDGKPHKFSSNRSFTRNFNPEFKDEIRNYIHDNGINLKKSPDQAVTDLINYIGKLE
jgi:hypothetical protein